MNVREIIDGLEAQLNIQTARANRLEAERESLRILNANLRRELRYADELAEWTSEEDHWSRVRAVETP